MAGNGLGNLFGLKNYVPKVLPGGEAIEKKDPVKQKAARARWDKFYAQHPEKRPDGSGTKGTAGKGEKKPEGKKPKAQTAEARRGTGAEAMKPGRGGAQKREALFTHGMFDEAVNVLETYNIDEDSDELQEMQWFKNTLGRRGQGRDVATLKRHFLEHMDPGNYKDYADYAEARKRVEQMNLADFDVLLRALAGEEEDEDLDVTEV